MPSRQHGSFLGIPAQDLFVSDAIGVGLLDPGESDRRREKNARVLTGAVEIGNDQELLVRHCVAIGQCDTAAARQQIAPGRARPPAANAIRIRERQQLACRRHIGRSGLLPRREPSSHLRDLARRLAGQGEIDAMPQVDIALAGWQAQKIALAQDGGQQGGDPALAQFAAFQDQVREARMLTQPDHGAAMRRDRSRGVDGAEIAQQRPCRRQ